jgi:hypothetical protein
MNAPVTHRVPAGTVNSMTAGFQSAMANVLLKPYEYCLLEGEDILDKDSKIVGHKPGILDINSKGLKERLLGKVAFACDAYIGITLQRKLFDMREAQELAGTAPWDSYQAFRAHVADIAASEASMAEAGMDVKSTRETIQALYNMRTACHDAIANIRGAQPMDAAKIGKSKDPSIYAVPNIEAFFRNPRERRDDAKTMAKRGGMIKNLASNDDGVMDVELMKELERSYEQKAEYKRKNDLVFDRNRGEMNAMLFRAFNLQEYGQVRVYEESAVHAIRVDDSTVKLDAAEVVSRAMGLTGEHTPPDAFGDLPIEFKYRLLHGMIGRDGGLGYIKSTLMDGISDWNVEFEEHAKWMIEARPLTKTITSALEHPVFTSVVI